MNYSQNKVPGKLRPYTFHEFLSLVENIAKEQNVPCINELDYFYAEGNWFSEQKFVDDYDLDVLSETHFGGSEGIYTRFYLWMHGKKIDFACAKNLGESEEDFINMHIFAAKVCLIARKYTWEHQEDFNWSGYDVGYEKDGKFVVRVICESIERAKLNAEEFKRQGYEKVIIRDNAEKKIINFS